MRFEIVDQRVLASGGQRPLGKCQRKHRQPRPHACSATPKYGRPSLLACGKNINPTSKGLLHTTREKKNKGGARERSTSRATQPVHGPVYRIAAG